MSRCHYPMWQGHQKKVVLEIQRTGKFSTLLNAVDRVLGRDLDQAISYVIGESLSLDPRKLADIFEEDVGTYVDRITNSERTVKEIYQENENQLFLENYVQI